MGIKERAKAKERAKEIKAKETKRVKESKKWQQAVDLTVSNRFNKK